MEKRWKGKVKIQFASIGTCSRCGREFVRPFECDVAACSCENPPLKVLLRPAVIMSRHVFHRLKKIADQEGVSVADLVFRKGLREIMEENHEKR